MDWPLAITRNQTALKRIVAALFAMFSAAAFTSATTGNAHGQPAPANLPRSIYAAILAILRPAESALRRLIVIAAWDLVLKPGASRPLPANLQGFASNAARTPTFCLFDPLKHFTFEDDNTAFPNGYFDHEEFQPHSMAPVLPVNATQLLIRMRALRGALESIQSQARRFARNNAKLKQAKLNQPRNAPFKPLRQSPIRPGLAPGWRQRPIHDVDDVLKECHLLARDLMNST